MVVPEFAENTRENRCLIDFHACNNWVYGEFVRKITSVWTKQFQMSEYSVLKIRRI